MTRIAFSRVQLNMFIISYPLIAPFTGFVLSREAMKLKFGVSEERSYAAI